MHRCAGITSVFALMLVLCLYAQAFGQDSKSLLYILLQPKEVFPHKWNVKEPISLSVTVEGEGGIRFLYVETNILLVGTRSHKNRIEAWLQVTETQRKKILALAAIDELWFIALPYRDSHNEVLTKQGDALEFLESNREYRSAGNSTWGVGGSGPRLNPPTEKEIKAFRKRYRRPVEQSDQPKSPSTD